MQQTYIWKTNAHTVFTHSFGRKALYVEMAWKSITSVGVVIFMAVPAKTLNF
jgi:hypothetical protein